VHRLEVLRIFAEKTGSPISERAGLSGKAGSDPSLLVACGIPRFARIDDQRSHLPTQEYRLRHKRFPSTSLKLAVATSHLYPRPVSPSSRLLRYVALSAGRSGLPSLPNEKYATAYFSVRKRTSKYYQPPTLLVSLFLGSGTAGYLRFGSAGYG
jgi:hypothetical protein